jgi:hypothetical protein
MALIDDVERSFYIGNEHASVPNLNSKLFFNRFVHMDAGLDVNHSTFVAPMCIESDGDTLI